MRAYYIGKPYLVATRKLTSVNTLALLRFANAMGGRSVGDGERNLRGGSSARHDVKLVLVPTRGEVSKA
jgi:hypothetical protein